MRRIYIYLCILTVVGTACSDSSRDGYNIPDESKISENKQLGVVLERLSESIKANPSNPWNYYKRAKWQFDSNHLKEALIDISRAEALSPNSGEILFLKSQILYPTDKEKSLENALYAEGQGYESPDLLTLIGNLYLEKDDFSKAREYFQHAEILYPYNGSLVNGKANYYAKRGDTLTAINNYKKAIKLRRILLIFMMTL